jgi:hypothetical protein
VADRLIKEEVWSYFERPVKSGVAFVKGEVAAIDTADSGKLTAVSEIATLRPIGYFMSSGAGDGSTVVRVKLFRDVHVQVLDNAGSNAVADTHVQSLCYFTDGRTVSSSSNSNARAAAGRVWGVTTSPATVRVEVGAP